MGPPDSHRVPRAPRYSGYCRKTGDIRVRGCHPLRPNFPERSALLLNSYMQSYNPATAGTAAVWALPRSLATTGGITFCFLLLRLLRCFSSPGSPPCKSRDDGPSARRVAPFGNPRVTGRLHLTAAYRSLPRPSSPSRAKASTVCPCLLSSAGSEKNTAASAVMRIAWTDCQ